MRDQAAAAEEIARQLDRDINFLVGELRPTALDDLGLLPALANYVQWWSRHFGVPVEVYERGMESQRLRSEIETTIYRIAQEALINVGRNADASTVRMLLERRGDSVSLTIEDDGRGYDPDAKVPADANKGMGVVNMRERAPSPRGRRVGDRKYAGGGHDPSSCASLTVAVIEKERPFRKTCR